MPTKIVVTGAAGRVGSQLAFLLAQGLLLPVPIQLTLLEKTKNLPSCLGLQLELEDCAFSSLSSIQVTDNLDIAFSKADYVFLCGATHCFDPLERDRIQQENGEAFVQQGRSIDRVCSPDALFLMVANPCNTNALILLQSAPHIPPRHFHALVRLDQNRTGQKVVIWGNHSPTVVPHCSPALITHTQQRGAAITAANNGKPACASVAYAAIEAMKDLIVPTPSGSFFASAMYTGKNSFGLDEDLVFGLPCRTIKKGNYVIAEEYPPSPELYSLIRKSEAELVEERETVIPLIRTQTHAASLSLPSC